MSNGMFRKNQVPLPDFILYKNTLLKKCKESKNTFDTAWKELKDNGYLIQYKSRNEQGAYCYEYELLSILPTTQKSIPGESIPGKLGCLINTDLNNTDIKNKNIGNFKKNSMCFEELVENYDIDAERGTINYIYIYVLERKNEKYTHEKWIEIIDNLNKNLYAEEQEDVEEIIDKYFDTRFEKHTLYHSTLTNILIKRQQELRYIGCID